MTQYLWPLFAVYWYISTEIMENFLHNNYVPFKDIVMDSFVGLNVKYFLKSYCQTYWAPILIMWGSWTLIFIIWVFSHSSVDYTVTYSIKTKGWLIQYIDLQLEPNILFSEFTPAARLRPIWIMDVVGREGWRRRRKGTKDSDDPNMISSSIVWSALCMISS